MLRSLILSLFFYYRFVDLHSLYGENKDDILNTLSYEGTTVFYVANFLYLSVAFLFSKGPPYRKAIYTNGKGFFF